MSNLDLDDFVDSNIISHGFVYYKRDYYFHVDTFLQAKYAGQYLLLFKHCYELNYLTNLETSLLKQSWSDIYTNLTKYKESEEPDGYAWAAGLSAYPGFSIKQNSMKAKEWTEKLEKPMQELQVQTDFELNLIFHEWEIHKIDKVSDLLTYLTYPTEE